MASTQSIPQLARQSKSAVVTITQVVPPPEISQTSLVLLLSLRRRMHDLEKEIETAETAFKEQLQAGAAVEPGTFRAYLKTTARRSVAWKAVCERKLGATYCRRVLAGTQPDTFTNLVVEA